MTISDRVGDGTNRDLGMAPASASEPARGRLTRSLSGFANWSMTFAACGATAGLFSLFGFSLASSGPAFFWGWPLIALGVLFICLTWAELSSHYPFAGVMYQWPAILGGRKVGWWVGWFYLFAVILVTTAYYFILPAAIIPLLDLTDTTGTRVLICLVAVFIAAAFNAAGVQLLGRFTELAVIAELVVLFIITTLVLIFGAEQPLSVFTETAGTGDTFGSWLPGFLGGGLLISIWVLYSFENSGTLGEETVDAERKAPRGVLIALAGSFVLGLWFLFAFIVAIPGDPAELAQSLSPVQDVIKAALPDAFATIYLVLIAFVVIIGANVVFTAATRQMFSMARDGQLPFSRQLSRTKAGSGAPYVAVATVAVITALPLLASQEIAVLTTGATAAIYLVYTLVLIVTLAARLRGWPRTQRAFALGRWGIPVNILAIAFAAFVTINLFWPRDATNPIWQLDIRASYWFVGAPLLIGLVYYVGWHNKRVSDLPAADLSRDLDEPLMGRGR